MRRGLEREFEEWESFDEDVAPCVMVHVMMKCTPRILRLEACLRGDVVGCTLVNCERSVSVIVWRIRMLWAGC